MATEDPLAWARDHTPVLRSLAAEYREHRPFEGERIAVASHLEATTGVLVETLAAGGADLLVTSSEPHSTDGDVVASLDEQDGIETYVDAGMTDEQWADGQHAMLAAGPDFLVDDGCELIAKVHAEHPEVARTVSGGVEQTTAGIHRLEAMDEDDVLAFPVYGVNDTPMKHCFDNVHGTGESVLASLMTTTNAVLSGATVVVAGYGYCGRGVARKARGIGAQTVVTEVDPRKALEAHMDGHRIATMAEAAPQGDYFLTTTGNRSVLREEHFEVMNDGAILANAGHFDVEIDLDALDGMAAGTTTPREGITRYHLPDGRHLDLLAGGRLVNLTGPYSQGHPAEVMDTTFATMAEATRDLLDRDRAPGLHAVPDRLDRAVAERKLDTLGASTDALTDSQEAYLGAWNHPDMAF